MSDVTIHVENISKKYQISRLQAPTSTLRETLNNSIIRSARRLLQPSQDKKQKSEYIWALKDVSFDVHHGEGLGLVGRNGAGKSTLLKVLSRITRPTSGKAVIKGRLTSLLEIGTGFTADLSGRENIYLNGVIMGMKRAEINRKFDSIVAFSEIEKFIDTPVKYYSTGMYARLAFAVAANLDPEVLIIDEVLAVGDLSFYYKCIDFMNSLVKRGITLIFVSHNVDAVERLCSRAVWLDAGSVFMEGPAKDVGRAYRNTLLGRR